MKGHLFQRRPVPGRGTSRTTAGTAGRRLLAALITLAWLMSPALAAPALAALTADPGGPYTGGVGEKVQFDGTGSTAEGGRIVDYQWDFGDGATQRDRNGSTTHAYQSAGVFTVTLTVVDNVGDTSTAATTATIVEFDAPLAVTVSITQPAPNALVSGTVSIAATTSADLLVVSVEFLVDGISVGTDDRPAWSITWNTTAGADGGHTLTAIATDVLGRTSQDSIPVTVVNDRVPTVRITDPAYGAVVAGTVSIVAAASDDTTGVGFFIDGKSIGLDLSGVDGWWAAWNTTGTSNGDHTIAVIATNGQGKAATDTIAVTVGNAPTTTTTTTTTAAAATTTTTATTTTAATTTTKPVPTTSTTVATNATLEVLGQMIQATTRAIGLSATSFTVEPLALVPGDEITLTLQLDARVGGISRVIFLLDGLMLGDPAVVTTGAELTFTRVLPADLSVGQHRIEVVTDEDPPEVLASRSVGVAVSLAGQAGSLEPVVLGAQRSTSFLLPVMGVIAIAGMVAATWHNRRRWLPRRTRT